MTDLASLIAELERATGPDPMLDHRITMAIEGWRNLGGGWREFADGRREQWDCMRSPKPYTSSIDAALTLIPEGSGWTLEPDMVWVRWMGANDVEEAQAGFRARGGSCTALALCIACLKARMQTPSDTFPEPKGGGRIIRDE